MCVLLYFLPSGEALQLQWELSRRDHERDQLTTELAALTAKVEEQSTSLTELTDLQKRYDALLQLYGEKLEESEELKLDLQDVKDMYKAQVIQNYICIIHPLIKKLIAFLFYVHRLMNYLKEIKRDKIISYHQFFFSLSFTKQYNFVLFFVLFNLYFYIFKLSQQIIEVK